jgi:hypothetical protein
MLFPDSFGVERRETTVTKAGDAVVFRRVTLSVIAPPGLQRALDWAIPFDTGPWTRAKTSLHRTMTFRYDRANPWPWGAH